MVTEVSATLVAKTHLRVPGEDSANADCKPPPSQYVCEQFLHTLLAASMASREQDGRRRRAWASTEYIRMHSGSSCPCDGEGHVTRGKHRTREIGRASKQD
jgi:hypothetical protein